MDSRDLELGRFFTINGKDIWKMESFFSMPSCILVNLETGEKKTFGMGGLTAEEFKRIEMPTCRRKNGD